MDPTTPINNSSIVNQGVAYKETLIAKLPRDVLLQIFGLLSGMDLSRCMRVCCEWKNLSGRDDLWKASLFNSQRFDVIDDFSSLVADRVLTWKEAVRFSPLTDFFAKIFSEEKGTDHLIKSKNIELKNIEYAHLYIPRSFIRYGNLTFTVIDSSNVEMKKNGEGKIEILEGKKGVRLTHLAVEGEFLFTLRTDGVIVQWDYQKRKIVQEIETAFAKGDSGFDLMKYKMDYAKLYVGLDDTLCGNGSFEVKNGFIVLKYPSHVIHECEIFNYANANESQLVTDKSNPVRLLIKNNKLFILKRCDVNVLDLITKEFQPSLEIKIDPTYFIYDIDVEKNILCASTCTGIILLIDTITGNEIKSYSFNNIYHHCWRYVTMMGNLFIGFSDTREVTLIDLNDGQIISEIVNFFDFEDNTLNPVAFTRLIKNIKANLSELKQMEEEPQQTILINVNLSELKQMEEEHQQSRCIIA